jgi:molybdopterin molybdotransferase
LEAATTLGCEKVGLLDALGRVLGEDIIAPRDNPPWNNSAMDGFAVRWEDIKKEHEITKPAELKIIEDVQAGQVATKIVGPGEAIRIMTGAPVPDGADTVVRVEYTEPSENGVRIFQPEPQGANIRPKGEDVMEGECIIPKGTQLRPGEIGMLAILAKSFVYRQLQQLRDCSGCARSWRHPPLIGHWSRHTGIAQRKNLARARVRHYCLIRWRVDGGF